MVLFVLDNVDEDIGDYDDDLDNDDDDDDDDDGNIDHDMMLMVLFAHDNVDDDIGDYDDDIDNDEAHYIYMKKTIIKLALHDFSLKGLRDTLS